MEGPYWNDQAGTNFYMLITPSGAHVELRLTATTDVYEAVDSSHLQLQVINNGNNLLVRPTDGTRMTFALIDNAWRCTEIKDRNGNYLTVAYNSYGDITTITDTMLRVVNFNYDSYANLVSITQSWNGQPRPWATFGWDSKCASFPGQQSICGPVLTQVGLPDNSRYNFDYDNGYGQVTGIHYYAADNHQRRYVKYIYAADGVDCPRVSERHDWAENWNGDSNAIPVPSEEAITYFTHEPDGACRMTVPDGTVYKEYYGASWQSGLTTQSEIWLGTVRQKWTTTAWTQDNVGVSYLTNPRVTETNVYDPNNRRRSTIEYGSYAQWSLPYLVKEYAANGTTEIRHTYTDYNLSQQYLDRRIIGLVSAVHMSDTLAWQTKVTYAYDVYSDEDQFQTTPAATLQHDASYDTSVTARGNLTSVSQWDTD